MMQHFSTSSFVAGIMIGLLLAAAWFFGDNPSLLSTPSSGILTTSSDYVAPESGAISVADQSAGPSVTVESVTVPPPGVWVAVREVVGNSLGNVLGAIRIGGPRTQVSIELLRATEPNRAYAIELYRDDAGGAFDPTMNSVYVDFDTSAPVISRFKTTQ